MQTKYFKIIKSLWLFSLVAFMGVNACFISCSDDEDNGTSEVKLLSYGPMPIARGAELRFFGENLDKVGTIILPPGLEIARAEFTEQTSKSIKLTVPQDAVEGYLQLLAGDVTLTTKTKIGYSEPISLDGSFSPNPIKPGSVLTLEGDYLNLVGAVLFTDRVVVDSSLFISQSRKQITLTVPLKAQTGKIAVSNGATDPIIVYSNEDLDVILPTFTKMDPELIKAGSDLTISGQNLDLVASVKFAGEISVEAKDFKSQNASAIVITTPGNIQSGIITLVSYSGISLVSTNDLTTVVPSNVSIQAVTRFKAGLAAVISGTDLNLVKSIAFSGGSDITTFTFADNKITIVIPDNALDGKVTLKTAAGKSVETEAITLVKPTVTSVSPNPVQAGSDVSITGTDLNLVKSLTFGGGISVDVTSASETSITMAVPVAASTGTVALNLANGTSVNTPSLVIDKPVFCFIPVLPGEDEISAGILFVFNIVNGDKLTSVKIDGNSSQFIVQGTALHVSIPSSASGATDLTLISSNGEITYPINIYTPETVVWEGPLSISWSDGGRVMVPISAFTNVASGSVMKIYFTQTANWGQAQINNGSWSAIAFSELNNDGYMKTDMYDKSDTEQELVLTDAVLNNIRTNASSGNAIIIQGQEWIVNKISIIK